MAVPSGPGPGPLTPLPSPPHLNNSPLGDSLLPPGHTATPSNLSAGVALSEDDDDVAFVDDIDEAEGEGEAEGDSDTDMEDGVVLVDDKGPSTSSTAAGTGEGSSSTAAVRTVLKAPRAGGSATRDWATKTVGGRRGGDKGSRGAKGGGGGGSGSGTGGAWGLEGERVEPNKVLDKDYKGKLDFDPFMEQYLAEYPPPPPAPAPDAAPVATTSTSA